MKKPAFLLALSAVAFTLFAQNGAKDKTPKKVAVPEIAVRWGEGDTTASKSVSVQDFRKLLGSRVVAADNGWQVKGFDFIYLENRVYEDSAGNPLFVTEYLKEYCPGDTISQGIKNLLPERVKARDTAYISGIRLESTGGKIGNGKPQRFLIKR